MLIKILVTLLIIAGAIFYLRHNRSTEVFATREQSPRALFRLLSVTLVLFLLFSSGYYGWWNWQDGRQIVTVTISSPSMLEKVHYQVMKKDIDENRIVTVDGIQVRLSSAERLTIVSSDQQ